jgi:hypothetical protein
MQLVATLAIVALAAAYVIRSSWKTLAGRKAGCAAGCGKCSAPAPLEPRGRISLPQV